MKPQNAWPIRKGAVVAALACGALSACEPYVFSDSVQTLSNKMGSIDASYQDSAQKILAERHLGNRIIWLRDKPVLVRGAGCDIDSTGLVSCDLVAKGTPAPTGNTTPRQQNAAPAVDMCESAADASSTPTADTVKATPPLQRTELLKALDNYTAALAAITKAQDRADFDNAAAKVTAAVGGLAQSAPGPYAAAAPVAKASSNAVLWLVGQDLDHRRLEQLQIATRSACEPIHVLAAALGDVLDEQRGSRLDGLSTLLILKIQAANIARSRPHVTDQAYGTAIDDAQAAADAFQTVRATNPQAAAKALSDAHDAFVLAVRNNDGEFAALITSLQTFAQRANDLANAAAATASGATPLTKKS